jgi:PPOX class probable F420-dependent enzyme
MDQQVREFLEEPHFAVLATVNRDGSIQQSVVWYERRDDHVMINTKRGRLKDRNIRRTGQASLCIDDGYRYVSIRGTVEVVDEPEVAQGDIRRLVIRYHGEEAIAEQMARFSEEERVTVRVSLDHVAAYGL